MKKIKIAIFSFLVATMSFGAIADVKSTEARGSYNAGKAFGETRLKYKIPEENYSAYLNVVMKNCAGLTDVSGNTVYAPGDPRLGHKICSFTMGVRDGFYGKKYDPNNDTDMPYERCLEDAQSYGYVGSVSKTDSYEQCLSGFVNYNNMQNVPKSFCPSATFETTIYDRETVEYKLPGGTYRENIMGFAEGTKIDDPESEVCLDNPDLAIDCRANFRCEREDGVSLRWKKVDETCRCIQKVRKTCSGDAPVGKTYCHCGDWVAYNEYVKQEPCVY